MRERAQSRPASVACARPARPTPHPAGKPPTAPTHPPPPRPQPEIGRFPSAAAEPTLKNINQARGYDVRPEDKKE